MNTGGGITRGNNDFTPNYQKLHIPIRPTAGFDANFSYDQIEKHIRALKNNKAAGPDNIPNEFLKIASPCIIADMEKLCTSINVEEDTPLCWGRAGATLIHKGGFKKKTDIANYRPIAVTSNVNKLYCSLLNERLQDYVEGHNILSQEQNGFRRGRRTTDNLFILSQMAWKKTREKKPLVFAFLDIEKAYDRINRPLIWEIGRRVGIPSKIINILKSLYRDTQTRYRLGKVKSGWVQNTKGVRQGCILSPLLFALFMEELSTRIKSSGVGVDIGGRKLPFFCMRMTLF